MIPEIYQFVGKNGELVYQCEGALRTGTVVLQPEPDQLEILPDQHRIHENPG